MFSYKAVERLLSAGVTMVDLSVAEFENLSNIVTMILKKIFNGGN